MSKIAVVGCQASGKTVFTAALADYYRPNQRVNQLCCMTPENANANRFSEMMIHQMRDLHEWPSATNAQRTMSLKWAMRRGREVIAQIEMLDFGGEVFRAAFRDDEGTPQNQGAVRQLVDHLIDANFIVVLVSLAEIARDINHTATDQDVVLDAESKWVTRGLLDLLKEHQSSDTKVVVALSQADRPEHKQLLETYGGAKELFEKAWPTVSAVYPDLTVISVASVSSTTMDNRPADGFKTDGVLSVMKEFVQQQFGDCDGTASRLAAAANELKSMASVPSPTVFTRKLNEFDKLLQQLYKDTAVISELYKREFQEYEKIKATCLQFVDVIADVERRPLDSQVNSTFWREQEQLYPILAGSIRSFERYYQRKVEQQREEARKQDEAAARAAAEHARMLKQQEEDRQMRIKLEAEASARHKREMEEQERKDELERIRRRDAILAKKEEERIAAEKAKREEEEKRLEAERLAKERASKAKSFFVRMIAIGLVLAAIAGITFDYYSDKQAKDRAKEIELNNSRLEQEQRIAKQNAEENARRAESERRRAEAEAERAKAESDARIAQAKADEEKAKTARAEKEAEQARLQAALEKARLDKEKAEADAKAEEEKRKAEELKEKKRKEQEAQAVKESEAKEASNLLDELRDAVSNDDLDRARERLAALRRKALTSYQKSVIKLCDDFCEHLEKANNGNVSSMMWIALQHSEQKAVVKQDRARAIEWYEKAANAGSADAMFILADWAKDGKGCPKDDKKAVGWYVKAAQAKNGNAMYRLGCFYSKGLMGLKQSRDKAYELFKNAKANGCTFNNIDEWLNATMPTVLKKKKGTFWGGSSGDDLEDLLRDIEGGD